MPTGPEVARETLIVILGAVCAAAVVGMFPALKQWIHEQWTAQQ